MDIRRDEVMVVNGRLTQIGFSFKGNKKSTRRAVFRCECGNITVVWMHRGTIATKSCGCLAIEKSKERETRHGHTAGKKGRVQFRSRVYRVWSSMIERCHTPGSQGYPDYGARGIFVCDRWHVFENFLEDMGEPEQEMSLDRRENDKGYCPENCRWATRIQQARNKRNNRIVEHNGESRCIAEWAEIYGISYDRLQRRIYDGWTLERAVTQPFRKSKRVSKE